MIRERAPAKLNLFLHILGRRADGYHDLESLVVFSAFGDELEIDPAPRDLSLKVSGPAVGEWTLPWETRDNSVMQAALWLAGHSPRKTQGARIHLEKNIPVAAGLGGGSSDAAAALRVLSRHWKINLDADDIERGCLKLGADVPVCWRARPTYVSGIGEVLEDAPPMPALALVIAHTKRALPTDAVFRELRDSEHSQPSPRAKLANWPDTRALVRYLAMTRNDLEAPAMRLQGEIARLLEDLAAEEGCLLARMSGSGAACFGIFETDAAAEAAAARLTIRKWWAVATRLLAPSPPGRGLG